MNCELNSQGNLEICEIRVLLSKKFRWGTSACGTREAALCIATKLIRVICNFRVQNNDF